MLEIREVALENGIPVITIPMPGFQSYIQVCAVGGGSRYETKEVNGISHLLEHMLFKGTKKRPTAQQIAIELENLGVENNAHTSQETIVFYISEPGRFFRQVTDILSDQLLNYTFSLEDLIKEERVVIEEMRMRKSDPLNIAFELIPELLYGDQPAGMTVLGTEEVVSAITREQVVAYTERYFNRRNMFMVVAGNVPNDGSLLPVLNEYYGVVPDGAIPYKLPLIKIQKTEPSIAIEKFDSPQTGFALVVPSPNLTNESLNTAIVLSIILGGCASSRLFSEVREGRGLVYDIGSFVDAGSDKGEFYIYGSASPANISEVLTVIKEQLSDLAINLVSEEELLKAKNIREGEILRRVESPMKMALRMVPQFMFSGKIEHPRVELEKLRAVTAEDVQQLAREMFTNPNLHLAIAGQHVAQEEEKLRRVIAF